LLGKLTRDYRTRRALSQEELAERTGLSSRAIRAIETGRSATPRPVTVRLLADALGLSDQERAAFCAQALRSEATADPATRTHVPHELPLAVPVFAGRGVYLRQLTACLDDGRPGAMVISGTAGVGKSTLAVHWAHQVADRFPDGQLFVNLHGFGPSHTAVDAGEAIRGFLQALEVPAQRIPSDLAGQVACYRSALAGRRILLLADNARDADHVRPLIPGNPDCLLLITSRRQLTSLLITEGAVPVPLDLPSLDEARALLAGRLGARRIAAETVAVDALVDRCARLPLALSVVAARAALQPGFPLASIVGRLDDAGRHLDQMHGGDAVSDVRTVFSWSYRQLSGAAPVFRLLGLHPGPDIDAAAAASLAGCPVNEVWTALTELTEASLTTEAAPGRYVLHDLMRSYAGELADRVDDAAQRRAARRRMLDFYLHTSHAAAGLLAPHNEAPTLDAAVAGTARVTLTDQDAALRWFAAEIATLLAVTRLATESGFDTHAWQLAATMHVYLHRQGRWHEAADAHRGALRAAERLGSVVAQASAHQFLGRALSHLNLLEARRHLMLAYTRFSALNATAAAARTQQFIGITYEQDDPARSLPHARLALRLATAAGDTCLQGRILNGLGWLHALLGDHAEAQAHCLRALHLMIENGDDDGAADAWDSLGFALHHLGDLPAAVRCYQRALELYRALGHRYYLATTLSHLGQTHRAAGHLDLARQVWQDALDIFTELRRPDGDQVRQSLAELTS
jgi:tetratricopeptide (TPR) repeat protein/transcriptional regulator with XRE-family HTH domain